jgi:hypothetical protein
MDAVIFSREMGYSFWVVVFVLSENKIEKHKE